MANHTARQITEWFLAWGEHNDAPLSNLKLQKLLYYAQGHYLGDHAKPLFEDEIEAWVHGPVVRSIYHFLSAQSRKKATRCCPSGISSHSSEPRR